MSEISKVKINNGGSYGIKDTYGRDVIDKVDERVTEIERKIEAGEIGGGGGGSVDFAIAAGEGENSIIANSISGDNVNHAIGANSFAMGIGTTAEGEGCYAEGKGTIAKEGYFNTFSDTNMAYGYSGGYSGYGYSGGYSGGTDIEDIFPDIVEGAHSEGCYTSALGGSSHTEGFATKVENGPGHAEGQETVAIGNKITESISSGYSTAYKYTYYGSHAEGYKTTSQGIAAHSEGMYTATEGNSAHAEGQYSYASGEGSHAEGNNTQAINNEAHAEGVSTIAEGVGSHTEGQSTYARGDYSHAEGQSTTAENIASHAEGINNYAGSVDMRYGSKVYHRTAHAEGYDTYAYVDTSSYDRYSYDSGNGLRNGAAHAEGNLTIAIGPNTHAEGFMTYAHVPHPTSKYEAQHGNFGGAHAEGWTTTAIGSGSHAEGIWGRALKEGAHAEGYDTFATGAYAHAEGSQTTANGLGAHSEGDRTSASQYAHAEGVLTTATGNGNHSEGYLTRAQGSYGSHSEGYYTTAYGGGAHAENNKTYARITSEYYDTAHAEGMECSAIGDSNGTFNATHAEGYKTYAYTVYTGASYGHSAHAEGSLTTALRLNAHAEGYKTYAASPAYAGTSLGDYATHAEGIGSSSTGPASHAEGYFTQALGNYSHSEGYETVAYGNCTHAEGFQSTALDYSHAEGYKTSAVGDYSHTEGYQTSAIGDNSHAEGSQTLVNGSNAHAEGAYTTAKGDSAHVEGEYTIALGSYSHAEGYGTTTQYGSYGHAEGYQTLAQGSATHAEGQRTTALNGYSHSEGNGTLASGSSSHAEGEYTTASGAYSHAEGRETLASQQYSHAEGYKTSALNYGSHAANYYTIAQGEYQTAIGKYNIADENDEYALIIGNGTGPATATRSNALTVDWDGNIIASGDIITKDGAVPSTTSIINTITDPDNYPIASAATYSLRSVPQKTEFKKIYMADHGYSLYGDIIDDNTMHKVVLEASGLDDNPYNIFEIKAPSTNAGESTLALMCSDSEIINFTDFSLMKYDSTIQTDGKPVQEIVMQSRGDSELPHFHMCFNNGSSGRVKKFSVHPDAIPMELTAEGLKIRKNNNFDNSSIASDYEIIDLIALKNSMINSYDIDLGETFTVIEGEISYLHYWDFTKSSIDSITGESAILTNCNTSSNGLVIDSADDNCKLGAVFNVGNTLEIEIANTDASFDTSTHGRFIMIYSSSSNMSEGLVWRHQTQSWAFYVDGSWDSDLPITDRNYFSGKTLKLVSDEQGYLSLYVDDEFIAKTNLAFDSSHNNVSIGGYANSFTNATITSVKIYNKEA